MATRSDPVLSRRPPGTRRVHRGTEIPRRRRYTFHTPNQTHALPLSAQGVSQKAVEMDGGVWQAHQWLAITTGSLTKHEGTQRKIEMGYKFKVRGLCVFMSSVYAVRVF